jgi:hypothetical protein
MSHPQTTRPGRERRACLKPNHRKSDASIAQPGAACKSAAAQLDALRAAVRGFGYRLSWAPRRHAGLCFMVTPDAEDARTVPLGDLAALLRFVENHQRWAARPHLGTQRMRTWHRKKVRAMERRERQESRRLGH